tara:strand:+ start:134 stop:358 length:225 start_codon:yes stop_codon:yes gene_type:complete
LTLLIINYSIHFGTPFQELFFDIASQFASHTCASWIVDFQVSEKVISLFLALGPLYGWLWFDGVRVAGVDAVIL